ncbi:uncharacterized protein K460DRAFT_366720 [Cucurbitaria berberidis CBS 394.84]|uniref:G domain-containing protein n=1 Tax=Cucurbitaria berberidis CBS 394.84 TaxID=1168544 RepID=A0A9P4GIJ8_9PLEO|nr:uncharacterized protein K460DRAFT_366720 [Cucurbitaria berberidis CBS 394.84]KAF1845874.1 hypothetical protein K460DRAFT_366720 [Cucurbitaria berberidis CBS 394.84]
MVTVHVDQTPGSEVPAVSEQSLPVSSSASSLRTPFSFHAPSTSTTIYTFGRGNGPAHLPEKRVSSTPQLALSSTGDTIFDRIRSRSSGVADKPPSHVSSIIPRAISSSPSFGQHSLHGPLDHDPDIPIRSVEEAADLPASKASNTGTAGRTRSESTSESHSRQLSEQERLNGHLEGLRLQSSTSRSANAISEAPSLVTMTPLDSSVRASPRFTTPHNSSPSVQDYQGTERSASTPSISVTPTPPILSPSNRSRVDSLANGVAALRMSPSENGPSHPQRPGLRTHLDVTSSDAAEHISPAPSPSPSPSPSRTRRSSSVANRIPYRVEDEEPPPTHFQQQAVQQACNNAKDDMTRMALALASADLHHDQGSTIHKLHQKAVTMSTFQPPDSRIIGFVGDAGVGKSSLINSLLDREDFARTSSSGSACTCVVTEYHYHDQNTFLIHIDHFTIDELQRQFQELLRAYRDYDSPPDDKSVGHDKDLERRAHLAGTTFRASFGQRLNENPGLLLDFPFQQAINMMVKWASQALTTSNQDGSAHLPESFDDVRGCSARLQSLTSENNGASQGCPWTFVRKVRVYIRAYILSKGLIIVDLPGLRDLNAARQHVTERYVRQCHQVFAVTGIDRAASHLGVREVFELARRASLSNVGVICTRSDVIKVNEAKTDWPAEKTRIDEFARKVDDAKTQSKLLEAEIKECEDEAMDLSEEEARELDQKLVKLNRELRAAKRDISKHKLELKQHIIQVRNEEIMRKIEDTHQNYLEGSNLRTFCIGNKLYWKNRKLPAGEALPYLRLSGILALRQFCIGIIAESHHRATAQYVKDEVPAFLGSVELWVQAGAATATVERRQQVLDMGDNLRRQLKKLTSPVSRVHEVSRGLTSIFNTQIYMLFTQFSEQWSKAAERASMEWKTWHHSSYSAFCRNYGTHSTAAKGYRCWNEEAVAEMKSDVQAIWMILRDETQSHLIGIQEFIVQSFADMINSTTPSGNMDDSTRTTLETLTGTLRHRQGLLDYAIENALEDVYMELSTLRINALSSVRTSIIGQLIDDSYHNANMQYGGGSDRIRKNIITEGFSSPTLFIYHRQRIKSEFIKIVDDVERKASEAIMQQVTLIEADLDTLKEENRLSDSERNPGFRKRVEETLNITKERIAVARRAFREPGDTDREDVPMTG